MLGVIALVGSVFLIVFAICYRRSRRNYETNRKRKGETNYNKLAESEDELFAATKYSTENETNNTRFKLNGFFDNMNGDSLKKKLLSRDHSDNDD